MNSHPFLIDDFVRAVVSGKLPPNNAWTAARCLVPGLVAHESARQGGKLLDIHGGAYVPISLDGERNLLRYRGKG